MAMFFANGPAVNLRTQDLSHVLETTSTQTDETVWNLLNEVDLQTYDVNSFLGTGFTYDAGGVPTGGIADGWIFDSFVNGDMVAGWTFHGIQAGLADIHADLAANNARALFSMLLSGNDMIHATAENDLLDGYNGDDTILGMDGSDRVFGGRGADLLYGDRGKDRIAGGQGNDTLTGGIGADQFVFDVNPGNANADVIDDFTLGLDKIVLDSDVYASLTPGALDPAAFFLGTIATSPDHHVIFDSTSGRIFYDTDGKGGELRQLIATVDAGTAISASDFLIV